MIVGAIDGILLSSFECMVVGFGCIVGVHVIVGQWLYLSWFMELHLISCCGPCSFICCVCIRVCRILNGCLLDLQWLLLLDNFNCFSFLSY